MFMLSPKLCGFIEECPLTLISVLTPESAIVRPTVRPPIEMSDFLFGSPVSPFQAILSTFRGVSKPIKTQHKGTNGVEGGGP